MSDSGIQQNISGSGNIFTATGNVFVTQNPESTADRQVQSNLRILLNKVRTFWIQGVLEKSIHHAVLLNLDKEVRPDSVDHPWGLVLELPDNERHLLPPKTDIIETFNQSTRALLILGEPGSGKTTTLLDLARKLIEKAEQDVSTEPIPVVFNLSSWGTSKSLFDWLVKELSEKYQIPKKIGKSWLEQNRLLPLLDGFDEIAEPYRQNCINSINEFIGIYGLPGIVVCSRITEYTKLSNRLRLNAAICVQPLTDKQVNQYLKTAIGKDHSLKSLLKKDDLLYGLAKTPLFLSILLLAHRSSSNELRNLSADNAEEYTQKIFDIYFERMLRRKGDKNLYAPEQVEKTLSWLAKRMIEQNQSIFYVEHLQPSWLSFSKERLIYYILSLSCILFIIVVIGLFGVASSYPNVLSLVPKEVLISLFSLLIPLNVFKLVTTLFFISLFISLFSPLVTLIDWQPIQKADSIIYNNNAQKLLTQILNYGRFVYLQSVLFFLWLHLLLLIEGVSDEGMTWTALLITFLNPGISEVVVSLLIFVFMEIFFILSLVKLKNFLNTAMNNSALGFWGLILYVITALSGLPLALAVGQLLSGLIILGGILLILYWISERIFLRVRIGLNLITILFQISSIIFLFFVDGIEASKYIAIFPLAIGIIVAFIKAFRDRNRNVANEIQPTENLSWSWKKSLPLIAVTISSLIFFFFSSTYKNDVIIWNSKTAAKISNLQEAHFTQWDASFSNDGRRILLSGARSQAAYLYLYNSINGEMLADIGAKHDNTSLYAFFNIPGTRFIVAKSCEDSCYAELRDAETGNLISTLSVELDDLEGFKGYDNAVYFPIEFIEGGQLISRQIVLQGSTPTQDVYVIWDSETGKQLLILNTINPESSLIRVKYVFSGDKVQLVDMGQIRELVIYDDAVLAQHPITITSARGNIDRCYWFTGAKNLDCLPTDINSKIVPWASYTISMDNNELEYFRFGYFDLGNGPGVSSYFEARSPYTVKYWDLNGFKTINVKAFGIDLPIETFPFSNVIVIENPALPRLITITDGNNILFFLFGCFLAFIIVVLFFVGTDTTSIEKRTLPNQGILLSLRNSVIFGVLMAIVSGLITYILSIFFFEEYKVTMYVFGLGLLAGTFVWAVYGGMDVVFHYTLRLILAKRGFLPWKLVPFLDYCADTLLLQKVGGGYIFIHRMLLENLAKKYQD